MKLKKILAAALVLALGVTTTTMTSMAVTRKKIESVVLTLGADIQIDGDIGNQEVDVDIKSEKYTYEYAEFENTGHSWTEEDIPQLKIVLNAVEGYYFTTRKDQVTVKPDKDTIKGNITVDSCTRPTGMNSETLEIVVTLPPLSEQVQPIEKAYWSTDKTGAWSESVGAGSYEVRLYRDGTGVGTTKVTTDTGYDFSFALTKAGYYTFKVRPVNKIKTDIKGAWTESEGGKTVDSEQAAANRIYNETHGITSSTPNPLAGTWVQDETGWRFQKPDQTYTTNNWEFINTKWYFFGPDSYMKTGWIDWNGKFYYCGDTNGDMLVDTMTPDGSYVGPDGSKLN